MTAGNSSFVGALPPPIGIVPNFENPDYIGYRVVVVALVFTALAFSLLSVRLYTKCVVMRKVDLDDYSIILGFLFSLAYATLSIYQTRNGAGVHIWDVTIEQFKRFMRVGGIAGPLAYSLGTLFIKVSILLLYLRLSAHRSIRFAIYIVMFIAVSSCMFSALTPFYVCTPIRRYWDFSVPGKCININAIFIAGAAFNVGTDVIMLFLPIWILWPLKINTRQKIGVTLILMAGSFVCVVSILRLVLILSGLKQMDFTWHYAFNVTWIVLEMYVGVICACLPSLKALIKHHFPEFFKDNHPRLERRIPSFNTGAPISQQQQQQDSANIFGEEGSANEGMDVQLKSFPTGSDGEGCGKSSSISSSLSMQPQVLSKALVGDRKSVVVREPTSILEAQH